MSTSSPVVPPSPGGLSGRARLSVLWNAGFTIFRDLLQLGVTLLLVRLLPAEAYGQFGFVTAALGFLTLCSFREFLNYTLLVRDDREVHYQDHFTAGLVIQVIVCVAANILALALRAVPEYAPASPLLHVMSVVFLLDLPSEFRVKMLERSLDWRRLRLLHAAALAAGAVLSVAMALTGWGVYALLLPSLLVPVPFIYDLFVREGWRPDWSWTRAHYQPAWRFGLQRVAAVSLAGATPLVEGSWFAKAAGFAALGVFGRAIGLAQIICGRITGLLSTAIFPVLTKIEPRTDAYRRASALYLRSVAWVLTPLCVVGGLLAGPAVRLLYGDGWLEVIPLMTVALASVGLAGLAQTGYMLLLAHHRQDRCFVADLWRLVGTVAALALLLPSGLQAYLGGLAIVHLVLLGIVLQSLHADQAVSVRGLRDAVSPAALSALCAAGTVWAAQAAGAGDRVGASWTGLRALLFLAIYVLLLRALFRPALQELVGYLPRQRQLKRILLLEPAVVPPEI